ncbi:hypothetical protein BV25DRAFT_1902289 [Artomyces pyxidatus]|uniref:Uncharacterized protein n=1 Tax=Artomyces pyxidatus TaxID=48021 RepID=A0ACB8SPI3_9AGAM|nr:hypothetical protein BV25DRAFT_1902289 [Artomyces pyxidatus]
MEVDGVHQQSSLSDDEDSLFGSPPPSPPRGRSPKLALPTGPDSTENVGTIALPGSHIHSELPLNPAALLLSTQLRPGPSSASPPHLPPHLSTSRPSSQGPSRQPSRSHSSSRDTSRAPSARRSTKGKERAPTPRPPPPPIHLPDPDEPPPNNFLRNQQALLGLAGLVGGVNPANLSKRHRRGSTSQNPIIIEDEYNPPSLSQGRNAFIVPSTSLPPVPSEEVIASLVKQKNIFPVLESLLRLLSGAGPSAYAAWPPPQRLSGGNNIWDQGPSHKRRKLSKVPAGAADWDVPYPFLEGEGPEQYRVRWEKERVKQLLSQLVAIVKGAARTAATRTFLQTQVHAGSPINLSADRGQQDIRDVTNIRSESESLSTLPPTTPFDNLIASLLLNSRAGSAPETSTSLVPPVPQPATSGQEDTLEQTQGGPQEGGPNLDSFDTSSVEFQELLAVLCKSAEDGMDVDTFDVTPSSDRSAVENPQPINSGQECSSALPDSMIDPTLLAMSMPRPEVPLRPISTTPALSRSPMASTSSLDPLTPQEEMFVDPEVYRPEQAEDPVGAATLLMNMAASTSSQQAMSAYTRPITGNFQSPATVMHPSMFFPPPPFEPHAFQPPPPSQPPALFPQPPTTITQPPVQPAHVRAAPVAYASTAQLMSLLDSRRMIQTSSAKAPNKQDILRRAKERRLQLAAELERAKVELWETTIEQGVLAHLVKDSRVQDSGPQ